MTKITTLIIAVLIALILGFHMFSFQVRYNEVAVVTTFGSAQAPTADDPGSMYTEPGLYFKWPWPFQQVKTYSTQLHVLEDELQENQTLDGKSVIIKAFVAWRIDDPYQFWNGLEYVSEAERTLRADLSVVNSVIGLHNFTDLVSTSATEQNLATIEAKAADMMREKIAPSGYGITIESVGIRRLLLPETVTDKVFERMKSDRNRLAQDLLSQGESEAGRIVKEAESKRDRILAFAESRAQVIEAKGTIDAVEAYDVFEKDPEFAIFLRQMQALERMLGYNTTFVFKADELDLLRMFKHGPAVTTDPQTGRPIVVPAGDPAKPGAEGR